jgi:autoinducer 2-degrading protein
MVRCMLQIVHVSVHVKPDSVEAFRAATLENARASVQEPGIARFDVLQEEGDPTRFVLVEIYRTPEAPAAHKETAHYKKWRDAVADMMAEPRTAKRYANVHPDDAGH